MTLVIDDPEVDRLAQRLAEMERVPVPEAVGRALRARLDEREQAILEKRRKIKELQDRVKTYKVYDDRTPDEIIGYDDYGVPR